MKIQNINLAGVELRMRSGTVLRGDDEGVFECEDEDARFLLATPGWGAVGSHVAMTRRLTGLALNTKYRQMAKDRAATPKESAVAESPKKPPAPPEPEPEPEPAVAAAEPPADAESEEGPDLDALDKDGLLKVAAEYGITVSGRWGEKRLREHLESELYEE